jgi:putative ABC transport system substrate-binding protein
MRRREFITLLGGAAFAWPFAAGAQQPDHARRIAVLMTPAADDAEGQVRLTAFKEGLETLGWAVGRNLQIDYRWGMDRGMDAGGARAVTLELLRRPPDVFLVNSGGALAALQQTTRTVPIVFVVVSEPVERGVVAGLAHPGGNITGFSNLEPTVGSKFLELLKEIAPGVTRFAVMFNPETSPVAKLFFQSTEAAAQRFAVQAVMAPVRDPAEIEVVMSKLGGAPGGGLIVPPGGFTTFHHKPIVELAARFRVPAIYSHRFFASEGGLLSYGADGTDLFRRAAAYIDRILRGEKPADMPVQQPTKFEFVINLKTAKALGITIPPTLLSRADEVIE